MTNIRHTVLYVGITNNLKRRTYEHRNHLVKGFTKRYNVESLVYYEVCEDIMSAIEREKQLKGGSRADKVRLIESFNPDWKDLYTEI
jgi:putative endonuclease